MVDRRRGRKASGAPPRSVATGSVFSTLLIAHVIDAASGAVEVGRVVDVGSGESPYRDVIGHDEYVGVDRVPRGRDALLVAGDATRLPLRSTIADAVLCTEVIEHVPDERQLVAELARIARPGALLLLSSPFVHGLHEMPYDYRRLTSVGLVEVLADAGWEVETVSPIGGPFVVALDSLVRWADSSLRRVARRLGGSDGTLLRGVRVPSAFLQDAAARTVLALGRNFAPIDPQQPTPRLTLGYVVTARRARSEKEPL